MEQDQDGKRTAGKLRSGRKVFRERGMEERERIDCQSKTFGLCLHVLHAMTYSPIYPWWHLVVQWHQNDHCYILCGRDACQNFLGVQEYASSYPCCALLEAMSLHGSALTIQQPVNPRRPKSDFQTWRGHRQILQPSLLPGQDFPFGLPSHSPVTPSPAFLPAKKPHHQ